MKYLFVFPQSRVFLLAMNYVSLADIKHKVLSMPDSISNDCSMVLEIEDIYLNKTIDILKIKNIDFSIKEMH